MMSFILTDARLAEIEDRLSDISAYPWFERVMDNGYLRVEQKPTDVNGICGFGDMEEVDGIDFYNARFIAHAPEDIADLLAMIGALRHA